MADWSELPPDLLLTIARKLINVPDDHYRLSCVCRSWSHVILDYLNRYVLPYSPCLMVPGINCDVTCKFRRLLSFPVGKDITKEGERLPQIPVPHIDLCRGSYEGWLVMIKNNLDMYLLNPFSDRRIDLPSETTLQQPSDGEERLSKWDVYKAILSKNPSDASDCFVMVLFDGLAFCKLGDKVWTPIHHQRQTWEGYMDALYFKGNFYIVSSNSVTYICDVRASPQPSMTKIEVEQCLLCSFFLVESRGELWKIYCGTGYDSSEDEEEFPEDLHTEDHVINQAEQSGNGDLNCFDKYDLVDHNHYFSSSLKTKYFCVWKLDTVGGSKPSWIDVENLDGVALFLGLNQSFSLSDPRIFGYQENRIYYTDSSRELHKRGWPSGYDTGIFNFRDDTIESLYKTDSKSVKPPAIWVTPKA
ncbi:uncharacterized protein LOC119983853 isoform X1 [Tripterygium wilfordii]|nr:uncharacterized protein LOC119983853 isoform X1 [Tripterygium wilfordii]